MFNLEKNIIPKPKEIKNSGERVEIARMGSFVSKPSMLMS